MNITDLQSKKEIASQASKKYYQKNRDKIKERMKNYYDLNKEKIINTWKKDYYKKNASKIQKQRKLNSLCKNGDAPFLKIEQNVRVEF
jgi:hypothetical protein